MRNFIKQDQRLPQGGVNRKKKERKKLQIRFTPLAKKQLTMLSLVLALMGAVYLNWRFEAAQDGLPITEALSGETQRTGAGAELPAEGEAEAGTAQEEVPQGKNYGDTLFVSGGSDASDAYFAEARLNRTRKRDEALDALEQALKKANLTESEKKQLTTELTKTASGITAESRIESQILAKGFRDCVAFAQANGVKIVVQSGADGLTAAEAAQIKEVVVAETGLTADHITIVEVQR